MIGLADLTNAMVTTLQAIPELIAMLIDPSYIEPYIDLHPDANSYSAAIYGMTPGSIMVAHIETILESTETMSMWEHTLHILVKAGTGLSALDIVNTIVDGIPVPGDGLPWRYCPIMDGLLPSEITDIVRETDAEGIDYHEIIVKIAETGDYFNNGQRRSSPRRTTAARKRR